MIQAKVGRCVVALATVAACILLSAMPASAAPSFSTGDAAQLISSTESGLSFAVAVPWQELRLEQAGDHVQVSLPGWPTTAQPGAPQLPQLVQSIGAPLGAQVRLSVRPGKAHTVPLAAPVAPVPSLKVDLALPNAPARPMPTYAIEADPAIYGAEAQYPGALAQLGGDGIVRQQRVVGIVAFPVQYDPRRGELTVYESLQVQVRFGPTLGVQGETPAAEESAAYESLWRGQLLNYDTARAWRRTTPSGRPAQKSEASAMSPEEATVASVSAQGAAWTPPEPGWRIKVREEGLYKLTYAQLLAAGVPVNTSIAASAWRLYNKGQEVAIQVLDANANGVFESTDALVFYGQPIASKYTQDNIYWLTYGQGNGLRMSTRTAAPGTANVPPYHVERRHMESNSYYVQKAPGNDALDRWMWSYLFPDSQPTWTHDFTLAAPYQGTYAATLRVAMLGYLQNSINPDHHAVISLNGTQVADVRWDGLAWNIVEASIPQKNTIVAGNNTLTVTAPNDTGVGYDVIYIDWAELVFANSFTAQEDKLAFTCEGSGAQRVQIKGFSTNTWPVEVYDVTNPAAVARLGGVTLTPQGTSYQAEFQDTMAGPTRYWARSGNAAYTPLLPNAIEQDTASHLQSTTNGADHITITHPAFAAAAQTLRDFRRNAMRAVVIDVQDVYDEFSYGIVDPAAIHDLLAYAYAEWVKPAPSFVVLMGDGHYDPKNYVSTHTSYIPPYLAAIDNWILETAADNRYVTLVGNDTLPDMMLGRLAVNITDGGVNEATAVVNKIKNYEMNPAGGDWRKQVLAVTDNNDSGGAYPTLSDNLLACCLPQGLTAEKVYMGTAPYTTTQAARAATLAGINAGKLIVNYIGHGGINQWADEQLFLNDDVQNLSNGSKTPVILALTCLEGSYHYPPEDGLNAVAEVITRADGKGAIASWSPTGLGLAADHDILDRGFFQALADDDDGQITLGEATMAGKIALKAADDDPDKSADLDLLDTYLLFGDPATTLDLVYPTNVQIRWFNARGGDDAITLRWETTSEFDIVGFNVQRAETPDGPKTKVNTAMITGKVPPGSPMGATYTFEDRTASEGIRYYYWLEILTLSGQPELHGPTTAQLGEEQRIILPVILR